MKNIRFLSAFLAVFASMTGVNAQDDLYYNPDKDRPAYAVEVRDQNRVTQRYRGDDDYYYDEGYDFEYSSRIRRFHRPVRVVDYYDPFFVDMWMYDPFFTPGVSIYVGGFADYWMWRRWMRWRAWNTWAWHDPFWGWGFNPWGWGWNAWNQPWYNPWVWNNYFYDPYWVWNGYNPYCPPNIWINNNYWYNNTVINAPGYNPRTYVGPRRSGTVVSPSYARIVSNTAPSERLAPPRAGAEVIELKPQRSMGRVETAPAERLPQERRGAGPATPLRTGREEVRPEGRRPETMPSEPYRPGREAVPERPAREARPERMPAPRTEPSPGRLPREETTPQRPPRREAPRYDDPRPERPSRGNDTYSPRRSYERPSTDGGSGRSGGGFGRSGSHPGAGSGRTSSPSSGGSPRGRNN